jgi:hypothetical protein
MNRSNKTCLKWHINQVGKRGQKTKREGDFLIEFSSKNDHDFLYYILK